MWPIVAKGNKPMCRCEDKNDVVEGKVVGVDDGEDGY
jgi:hypothetical protein